MKCLQIQSLYWKKWNLLELKFWPQNFARAASPIRKIEAKDRTRSKSVAALPLVHEGVEILQRQTLFQMIYNFDDNKEIPL